MRISGLQKTTLLDYPGLVACIIFTKGCNFTCPFCQNSSLIKNDNNETIDEEEIYTYLEKRKKIIDGVVISGGEPTIHKDLRTFISRIKEMGYKVKLDTNGYNPKVLKDLIEHNLLDYVAMDIKADISTYSKISGCTNFNIDNILESINILNNSNISFEFRTTVMKEYHNIETLSNIIDLIGSKANYYIQNFKLSDSVIDKDLTSFTDEELLNIQKILSKKNKNIKLRGLYSETREVEVYV